MTTEHSSAEEAAASIEDRRTGKVHVGESWDEIVRRVYGEYHWPSVISKPEASGAYAGCVAYSPGPGSKKPEVIVCEAWFRKNDK